MYLFVLVKFLLFLPSSSPNPPSPASQPYFQISHSYLRRLSHTRTHAPFTACVLGYRVLCAALPHLWRDNRHCHWKLPRPLRARHSGFFSFFLLSFKAAFEMTKVLCSLTSTEYSWRFILVPIQVLPPIYIYLFFISVGFQRPKSWV